MIKIDFSYSNIKLDKLLKYQKIISNIENNNKDKNNHYYTLEKYHSSSHKEVLNKIKEVARKIKANSEVFVVCGIGGSYLGAKALIEALTERYKKETEIVFLGNSLDEKEIKETLQYLENKNFSINVISKSGSTLETAIVFRLLKQLLTKKYKEKANERIYVTTDKNKSKLLDMAKKEGYEIFSIPKNIEGRYSVFTSVGLLPAAVANLDIETILKGAKKAALNLKEEKIEKNPSYQYALYRFLNYKKKNKIELFVSYRPSLTTFQEWWKQLFAESEGKKNKGLFPSSSIYSTDLHSLGQFVQEGSKILFETVLKINDNGQLKIKKTTNDLDNLNYLSEKTITQINKDIKAGTLKAHYKGNINNLIIEIENLDDFKLGYLMYFFIKSCVISSFLLKVNPFNQPGVELYKKEVIKNLQNKNQ